MSRKKLRCERMFDKEIPCELPSQMEVVLKLREEVERLNERIYMYRKEIKSMNRSLERKTLKLDKLIRDFRAVRETKEIIEKKYWLVVGEAE